MIPCIRPGPSKQRRLELLAAKNSQGKSRSVECLEFDKLLAEGDDILLRRVTVCPEVGNEYFHSPVNQRFLTPFLLFSSPDLSMTNRLSAGFHRPSSAAGIVHGEEFSRDVAQSRMFMSNSQCRDAAEAAKFTAISIQRGKRLVDGTSRGHFMAVGDLERIRNAILDGRYTLTEHAYDEMDEDHLDVLDVESAILTGEIDKVLTLDPRGTRFVVIGTATDEATPVAVVVRFLEQDRLLIITVYEI